MGRSLPSAESLSPKAKLHRVSISGSGETPLILVHGFGTDQNAWQHVLPALLPDYRIIRLDLAGSGPHAAESFDPDRHDEIESYADDVLEILDELGIRDAFYVGASVGGMIGVLTAIEQPRFFRKLILIGASPRYLNDTGYVGGFDQATLDGIFDAMAANYQGWVSGFAPVAVHALPESSAAKEFAAALMALRPDIALNAARSIFQSDVRDRLPMLRVPATILQMRNDIAVPVAVGEYLRDHLPEAELDIIAADGHLPHLSAPAVVIDALHRHLGRHPI